MHVVGGVGAPRPPRPPRTGLPTARPYNRAMTTDTTDLEKRFGFLIVDVGRLYGKRYDELAKSSLDLTRAQCRMIAYLAHYGAMNQASLAEQLEVAPISAGRLLERMEEAGWVVRTPNPDDRRELLASLTPKAEGVLSAARRVGDEVQDEALAGFTPEEAEQFSNMLQRVRGNLSALVER
ncbi:transcriptional regulator, MarR family [Paraburkholderia tropica]|uniref:Transcriptional regulator, MarR family n=2 Tax=Burkholderiaceae TaxID=119060 RepID=A0AAQ1JRY6_9BURK|nr:transcriptional regulator, MarR family [Paraburkholderia tropica]